MRKLILILLTLAAFNVLLGVDFSFDGENRTRAAIYNDDKDSRGNHVDNKLLLGMNSDLTDELKLRVNLQFGDVVWGGNNGGGIAAGVPVRAYELYIDYRIEAIKSNLKIGQQYWADHRSLMIDDSFSGIMFSHDDLLGFNTDLGWILQYEGDRYKGNDVNTFLLSMQTEKPLPLGLQAFFTLDNDADQNYLTLLPYLNLDFAPLSIDLTGIVDLTSVDDDDDIDFGTAVKGTVTLEPVEFAVDVLYYANEDQELNYSISPYYMNGLYIFGIGEHFDGYIGNDAIDWYWGQTMNKDMYLGSVASIKAKLNDKFSLFGAAGLILDTGSEVNGGLEISLIPESLDLAIYGAYGAHKDYDYKNYLFGTTLKASF